MYANTLTVPLADLSLSPIFRHVLLRSRTCCHLQHEPKSSDESLVAEWKGPAIHCILWCQSEQPLWKQYGSGEPSYKTKCAVVHLSSATLLDWEFYLREDRKSPWKSPQHTLECREETDGSITRERNKAEEMHHLGALQKKAKQKSLVLLHQESPWKHFCVSKSSHESVNVSMFFTCVNSVFPDFFV